MRAIQVALVIIAVLALLAGVGTLLDGAFGSTPNMHPEYRDVDGDGFVPAQGDPLYDEHYAKDVNSPNADALDTLADSHYTEAEAERIRAETQKSKVSFYLFVGTLAKIAGFLVWAMVR